MTSSFLSGGGLLRHGLNSQEDKRLLSGSLPDKSGTALEGKTGLVIRREHILAKQSQTTLASIG
jgi:hypothetical protein